MADVTISNRATKDLKPMNPVQKRRILEAVAKLEIGPTLRRT